MVVPQRTQVFVRVQQPCNGRSPTDASVRSGATATQVFILVSECLSGFISTSSKAVFNLGHWLYLFLEKLLLLAPCLQHRRGFLEVTAEILNRFWIQVAVSLLYLQPHKAFSEAKRPLHNRFRSETVINL
jgi:hypothetical protein